MHIAFVVDVNWAFGRIAYAVAECINRRTNEHGHIADVYHGCGGATRNVPKEKWQSYDVIYVPEWDWKQSIMASQGSPLAELHERIVFGVHSIVQFTSMDVADWADYGIINEPWVTEHKVNALLNGAAVISPTLMDWFVKNAPVVGCVSEQAKHLLQRQFSAEQCSVVVVMATHCGVNDQVVDAALARLKTMETKLKSDSTVPALPSNIMDIINYSYVRNNENTLKVLIGTPPNRARHAYDLKRLWIVDHLRDTLHDEGIEILGPDRQMTFEEMDVWYDKHAQTADVVLCTSHAEGNPMSLIEGGGRGLIAVTTNVGIASEIIKHGWNGYIIEPHDAVTESSQSSSLVDGFAKILRLIRDMSREERLHMRRNMLSCIDARWRWSFVTYQEWLPFLMLAHHQRSLASMPQSSAFSRLVLTNKSIQAATSASDTMPYKRSCELAVRYDHNFDTFKRDNNYRGVLEHLSSHIARLYKDVFDRYASKYHVFRQREIIDTLVRNDQIGQPMNIESHPFIVDKELVDETTTTTAIPYYCCNASPSTLRYMTQCAQIRDYFPKLDSSCSSTPTRAWNIAEIGAGYGGLCYMMLALFSNHIHRYSIFDLGAAARLTQKYLHRIFDTPQSSMPLHVLQDKVRFTYTDQDKWYELIRNGANDDEKNRGAYDLVISHFGLTDCYDSTLDALLEHVVRHAKRGIITAHRLSQTQIENLATRISEITGIAVTILQEVPCTCANNRVLLWGNNT